MASSFGRFAKFRNLGKPVESWKNQNHPNVPATLLSAELAAELWDSVGALYSTLSEEEACLRGDVQAAYAKESFIARLHDAIGEEGRQRERLTNIEASARRAFHHHEGKGLKQVHLVRELDTKLLTLQQEEETRRRRVEDREASMWEAIEAHSSQEKQVALNAVETMNTNPKLALRQVLLEGSPQEYVGLSVSSNFISCAESRGSLHLFERKSGAELCKLGPEMWKAVYQEGIKHLSISNDEEYLAFATTNGLVCLGKLQDGKIVIVGRFEGHQVPVTSLCFVSDKARILLISGDGQGSIMQVEISAHSPPSQECIFTAEGSVVQLSSSVSKIIISTTVRTYILPLATMQPLIVGSQPHRKPAMHGSCLLRDGFLYLSRANGRLWKANAGDGQVLNTLKLTDAGDPLLQPALLHNLGTSEHVLHYTGAHISLLNVARVSVVCTEPVLAVVSMCCYGTACYFLCRQASTGQVVLLQMDLLQPIAADWIALEKAGRERLLNQQSVGWNGIAAKWTSDSQPELLSLAEQCREQRIRLEVKHLEQVEILMMLHAFAGGEITIEMDAAHQVLFRQWSSQLRILKLAQTEAQDRMLLSKEEQVTSEHAKELFAKQSKLMSSFFEGMGMYKKEEIALRMDIEAMATQATLDMKIFASTLKAERTTRDKIFWEESDKRDELAEWRKMMDRKVSINQSEERQRIAIEDECTDTWRGLAARWLPAKLKLNKLYTQAIEWQTSEIDGRAVIMDSEYDKRRQLFTQERVNLSWVMLRGVLQEEDECREMQFKDEAVAWAEIFKEGQKWSKQIEALRVQEAIRRLTELEHCSREGIKETEETHVGEMIATHQQDLQQLIVQAERRTRTGLTVEELELRRCIVQSGETARHRVVQQGRDRQTLKIDEEEVRKQIRRQQVVTWKALQAEMKEDRSRTKVFLKSKNALAMDNEKKWAIIAAQEGQSWCQIMSMQALEAMEAEERLGRRLLKDTCILQWVDVVQEYTQWTENCWREFFVSTEVQVRSILKAKEAKSGQRCLVKAFETHTKSLYVHCRNHQLHKEHSIASPCASDAGLLQSLGQWTEQFLLLRETSYLLGSDNPCGTFSQALIYAIRHRNEVRKEGRETDSTFSVRTVVASEDILDKVGKVIGLYVELLLSQTQKQGMDPRGLATANMPGSALARMPLEELILDLLTTLYGLHMDTVVDLEVVAESCHVLGMGVPVKLVQCCVLSDRRLPFTGVDPQYKGPNKCVRVFFETIIPLSIWDPASLISNGGGYLDCLLLEHDEEALPLIQRLKRFTINLWYIPYAFAVSPAGTAAHCVSLYPSMSWKDVLCLWSPKTMRCVHQVLNMEYDDKRQAFLHDARADYMVELSQRQEFLNENVDFVHCILYQLACIASRASSMPSEIISQASAAVDARATLNSTPPSSRASPGTDMQESSPISGGVSPYSASGSSSKPASPNQTRDSWDSQLHFDKFRRSMGKASKRTMKMMGNVMAVFGGVPPSAASIKASEIDPQNIMARKVGMRIKHILDSPMTYTFDEERIAQVFISAKYYEGLTFLGMEDTYIRVLLENKRTHELLTFVMSHSPEEQQIDVWGLILSTAYFMLNTSSNSRESISERVSMPQAGVRNDSGCFYQKLERLDDGTDSDELQRLGMDDGMTHLERVVCMLCAVRGATSTLEIVAQHLPDPETSAAVGQIVAELQAQQNFEDDSLTRSLSMSQSMP